MTKRAFMSIKDVDLSDDAAIDRWAESVWAMVTAHLQDGRRMPSTPQTTLVDETEHE